MFNSFNRMCLGFFIVYNYTCRTFLKLSSNIYKFVKLLLISEDNTQDFVFQKYAAFAGQFISV